MKARTQIQSSLFSKDQFLMTQEWNLQTCHLGQRVLEFDQLDSTNSMALELAQKRENAGLVILAREQTAGRGQYGRNWQASPGSSVLMSVLLFPPPALQRPALLTAWAAVSVCGTIAQMTGMQPRIKWPNDIFLDPPLPGGSPLEKEQGEGGKKVCGILIEQRRAGEKLASVIGIGLNVLQSADYFVQANLPLGGSLFSLTGKTFACARLAQNLIISLDDAYGQLMKGTLEKVEIAWKERLGLVGKSVRMETSNGIFEGKLRELDLDGLVLELAQGESVQVIPEMVRHLEKKAN